MQKRPIGGVNVQIRGGMDGGRDEKWMLSTLIPLSILRLDPRVAHFREMLGH